MQVEIPDEVAAALADATADDLKSAIDTYERVSKEAFDGVDTGDDVDMAKQVDVLRTVHKLVELGGNIKVGPVIAGIATSLGLMIIGRDAIDSENSDDSEDDC